MFVISTMTKNMNNYSMPLIGMLMIAIVMLLMVMLCKSRKERMSNSLFARKFRDLGPDRYMVNKRNVYDHFNIPDKLKCADHCMANPDCNAFQYYGPSSRQRRVCRLVHANSETPQRMSGAPPMHTYVYNARMDDWVPTTTQPPSNRRSRRR